MTRITTGRPGRPPSLIFPFPHCTFFIQMSECKGKRWMEVEQSIHTAGRVIKGYFMLMLCDVSRSLEERVITFVVILNKFAFVSIFVIQ